MTPEPRRPHHHGNLRQALIAAGLALLSEGQLVPLTLRQTAARAGVSHAAPAHHFAGLPGLLTAIAAQAFTLFTDHMIRAREAAGPEAFARLGGSCAGYLDFAASHAGLFQLMFAESAVDRTDPALAEASAAAYGVLREACQPFAAKHPRDKDIETAVWSLVHGYAVLGFALASPKGGAFTNAPAFSGLLRRLVHPQ